MRRPALTDEAMKKANSADRVGVIRVARCRLAVSGADWPYAEINRREISEHWQQQTRANPSFFDGTIYLLTRWVIEDKTTFVASFLQTKFSAYLYWRNRSFEDAGVWDAFGSAVLRSSDGAIVLGRQCAGNVNAGLSYPPSGFIDGQDLKDGLIDIDAHVAREVFEETGIASSNLEQQPGYWIAFNQAQVSIALELRSSLSERALFAAITSNLAGQNVPELAEIHMVRSMADLEFLAVPPYVLTLLEGVFQGPDRSQW